MIELHIFTQEAEWADLGGYDTYQTTWEGTIRELGRVFDTKDYNGNYKIATTQIGVLYCKLLDRNLRVFVHDETGCYEIKLGMKLSNNARIHRSNNLFSFWYNGMFKK